MYLLIIITILFTLCVVLAISNWAYKRDLESLFGISGVILGIFLLIMLAVLIANNYQVDKEVQQRLITKQEIEKARNTPSQEVERVAILNKIIDYNKQIAADKYDNNTQWDLWIPDTLAHMEPIK